MQPGGFDEPVPRHVDGGRSRVALVAHLQPAVATARTTQLPTSCVFLLAAAALGLRVANTRGETNHVVTADAVE